jgi:Flp pilus assembly pilin Flp
MTTLRDCFWKDESGQDIVEYTLLLAAVCFTSAAILIVNGSSISSIWHVTDANLDAAKQIVAS